jgi:hypothetical protein
LVESIRPYELFREAISELIEIILREEGWCPSEEDPAVWIAPSVVQRSRWEGGAGAPRRRTLPFVHEYFCIGIPDVTGGKTHRRADAVGRVSRVEFRRCREKASRVRENFRSPFP